MDFKFKLSPSCIFLLFLLVVFFLELTFHRLLQLLYICCKIFTFNTPKFLISKIPQLTNPSQVNYIYYLEYTNSSASIRSFIVRKFSLSKQLFALLGVFTCKTCQDVSQTSIFYLRFPIYLWMTS